jgi:ribonuclease BN (tRNA processing enzyme)
MIQPSGHLAQPAVSCQSEPEVIKAPRAIWRKLMIRRHLLLFEKFIAGSAKPLRFSITQSRPGWRETAWAILLGLFVLPCACMPQSTPSGGGAQILLLGTSGGPSIGVNRSEPSSLLSVDGRRYLIDCGIGTMRRLARAGFPSETIRTIFITHHHPDHDLGLADVMSNDFFTMDWGQAEGAVNIYGPPETKEFVRAAVDYLRIPFGVFAAEGLTGPDVASRFAAHDITQDGVVYQDDKIRVTAAGNSHYTLIPQNYRARMKSYSLRFETPYGVIVFTGDTGPSDAVVRLAEGADVLVIEATINDIASATRFAQSVGEANHWSPERTAIFVKHMTLAHLDQEEIGKIAAKAKVKAVLLYHFDPQDPAAYVAGVEQYFSGPVFAGADLSRYCLGAKSGGGAPMRVLEPCD